jgi:hypothetical protein
MGGGPLPVTFGAGADDAVTEPEITVILGAVVVPDILIDEFGATVLVVPLLRETLTEVLPVVIVSPETSGYVVTPGVFTAWPSRVNGVVLVTVATLWANAEKTKQAEQAASAENLFIVQISLSRTGFKYTYPARIVQLIYRKAAIEKIWPTRFARRAHWRYPNKQTRRNRCPFRKGTGRLR